MPVQQKAPEDLESELRRPIYVPREVSRASALGVIVWSKQLCGCVAHGYNIKDKEYILITKLDFLVKEMKIKSRVD